MSPQDRAAILGGISAGLAAAMTALIAEAIVKKKRSSAAAAAPAAPAVADSSAPQAVQGLGSRRAWKRY